jgi:putative ABC transport system permease protein
MLGRYGALLRRNLLRNRRRSVLTALSLAVSIFLIVTLEALLRHLDDLPRAEGSERRLVVRRANTFQDTLPETFGPRIEEIPGVQGTCALVFYLGIYKEMKPEYFFPKLALDGDRLRANYPETGDVDPETGRPRPELYDEFLKDRRGASAGITLFRRYGWKLGDRIVLQGAGFPDVDLTLRSCYDGPENATFFFHRDYLEELMGRPGRVSFFSVICKTVEDLPRVALEIDALFANSEAPTIAETEKAFQAFFVQLLGNVHLLMRSIALACAFAMMCVAGNTVAMTARERLTEVALLKTVGFTPGLVLRLLFVEVAILCVVASAAGAGAAKLLFAFEGPWNDLGGGFLRGFRLPAGLALLALPLGVAIGWISAAVPLLRVAYAPIASSLRRPV